MNRQLYKNMKCFYEKLRKMYLIIGKSYTMIRDTKLILFLGDRLNCDNSSCIKKGKGLVMKDWKEKLQSPSMVFFIFAIKLIVYYILIGVNIFSNLAILCSVIVLGCIFFVFSRSEIKGKGFYFLGIYTFFSIIMFADTMYYNYYNQTVSIKQLWQASNVAKVPSSFIATLIPASFLLILDIPFVYYYFKKDFAKWMEHKERQHKVKRIRQSGIFIAIVIMVISINPMKIDAFTKLGSVEFFANHIGDIYRFIEEKVSPEVLPKEEVLERVEKNVNQVTAKKYHNIASGKNLILIQIEAYQNFLIGAEYNGQELSPNLNQLLQKDTLYFDHFYSNIGKGNTADAEFSTLNSLYPVQDREAYSLYETNTFNGLPWLLRDLGYQTFAVHGYEGSFWNRENAYPYQGFQDYYSMEDLEQDEIIGLGISDQSVFRQSMDLIKNQTDPYFAFIITLTNHHPYLLDEDKKQLTLLPEHENTKFGSYLQTAYYTDQVIGEFIEELKANGEYEDTVIAMYGDHHGLNSTMDGNDEIMSEFLGKTYDYDEMLKVPLIIHIPNSGIKETISTVGGQIDFLPTIANLMGIEYEQPYVLGQDLVNAVDGFVAFTVYLFEGSFASKNVMFEISREGIFDGSRAWDLDSQEPVDILLWKDEYERTIELKKASKEILDQDLIKDYVTHEVMVTKEKNK